MSGIAITFPSSPSEGQVHLAQNGFTYIYDSQKNRWKRGGEFVRSPKVLSYAGVAVTTVGVSTGPTGALIYEIPETVNPNSTVGVDSYKAYRASDSYPNYTEVQVSISSAFSSIVYDATFAGTTHTIPSGTLSGDATYYVRARQFVGSDASSAGVGAISGYSANIVSFATTSTFIDTPTIVSISGSTDFPVYQIGYASTTLPATVTYTGSGVNELDRVDWGVTGPRIPSSTGDTALAEIGIGTHSSATLANALVLAMPFSGATGVGITDDVNNAIRTASSASAGTTKTITNAGAASTVSIAGLALTSHFYPCASFFNGTTNYLTSNSSSDFSMGTGDFTVEGWVYQPGYEAGDPGLWTIGSSLLGTNTPAYSGSIGMGAFGASNNISVWNNNDYSNTGVTQKYNVWYHFANVRRNGVQYLYIDGVLVWSVSDSTNYTGTYLGLGAAYGSNFAGRWYIQDLKVYKGLAKYTENFTPPLPTYGTISYTTGTTNTGINTTAFYQSTGDVGIAETSSTAADALVLAMPMNKTFGFQDINVAVRGLTSGASAGTAKTVGLGTTSTAYAPTHPRISATESKWYDGAAYFTVGDYATVFSNTDFDFGSSPFTMEAWIYPISGTASILVFDWRPGNTTGIVLINADGALSYWNYPTNVASTGKVQFNAWNHCAWVFSSSTVNFYINGIFAGSGSASVAQPDSSSVRINGQSQGTFYIQDAKIYKGFAKYTANFTPPQPICGFSTDISTQTGFTTTTASGALLSSVVGLGSTSTLAFDAGTHYSGITSITSSSGISTLPDPYAQNLVLALPLADITGAGGAFTNDRNTQIRSVSLVGGSSTKTITNTGVTTVSLETTNTKLYNNAAQFGSGKVLTTSSSSDFNFGTGDFTVEYWLYRTSLGSNDAAVTNYSQVPSSWFMCLHSNSNDANLFLNGSSVTSGGTAEANVWNHYAFVRTSGNCRIYKNGTLIASATSSASAGATNVMNIGAYSNGTSFISGYIQDVRIYNSAKYTTNFTPPPPMFGDYTRSTPKKVIFTPASDYALEAKNTSGEFTSSYSATRQFGTKKSEYPPSPITFNSTNPIVDSNGSYFDLSAPSIVNAFTINNNTNNYASNVAAAYTGTNYSTTSWINGDGSGNNVYSFSSSIKKWSHYTHSIGQEGSGGGGPYWQSPISNNLNVDWSNGYTLECWLYPRTFGGGSWNESGGIFTGYGFYRGYLTESNPGSVTTFFFTGTNSQSLLYVPTVDTWVHVAMVGDPDSLRERIYINGSSIGYRPGTITSVNLNNTNSNQNGRLASNGYRYIGYYQDYRVYNYQKYR